MSENPWKKQADANKPPVAKGPPGTGAPPPWMKKAQLAPPAQTAQSQPQVTAQQPVVAVKPPPPTATNPPGNVPPWMKNNQATQPPATTAKPPQMTPTQPAAGNTGSMPPWMKNKQTTSPIPTDRKMEEQKQKEEEEARLKKMQQEQQEKRRKEQEIRRQEIEQKRMQIEQQHSKIRQQQDSKKKPQKGSKKSPKKQADGKTALGPRKNPNSIKTIFHQYLYFFSLACSRQQDYSRRLEYQKQYIEVTYKYAEEVRKGIRGYMAERKVVVRKKNVINLENIVIDYALVEGLNSTGNNNSLGAYFKTKNMEILEQKAQFYEILYHAITRLVKKNNVFRLRVPFICRASFKGIQFLCESVCDQLLDSVLSPVENFVQLHGQLSQLEKELKQLGHEHINRKILTAKKVALENEQYYILYLAQNFDNMDSSLGKATSKDQTSKQSNAVTTIDSIINVSLMATKKLCLNYTFMRTFKEIKKNTTQTLQKCYLDLFQTAHAIRVVYASCQGEVEDDSFWNLIFDGNAEMWGMIRGAYQGIYGDGKEEQNPCKLRNKFMLAKILQAMLPVSFRVGKQKTGSPQKSSQIMVKKKPLHLESSVEVITYPLDWLQIYQISQLFDKTIENPNKIKISQDSRALQQDIGRLSQELYTKKVTQFANKQSLLFQKGMVSGNAQLVEEAIAGVERYEFEKGKEMDKVVIYPLLIKFYINVLLREGQLISQPQKQDEPKNETQKSKLEESQVKEVYFSSQEKKEQEPELQQHQSKQPSKVASKKPQDYEVRLIKIFKMLLDYVHELFEDQEDVWIHAGLYMVLASYYSKSKNKQKGSQQKQLRSPESTTKFEDSRRPVYFGKPSPAQQKTLSKSQTVASPQRKKSTKQFDVQTQSLADQPQSQTNGQENEGPKHPYRKQCLKLVELAHCISLQYYGTHSVYMAQLLYHEAEIYYNIHELQKCEQSIEQALKIYKSSSKNNRNILHCYVVLGKSIMERGKGTKDSKLMQKGIEILQSTAQELIIINMEVEAIEVYEFLCANYHRTGPSNNRVGSKNRQGQESSGQSTSRSMEGTMDMMVEHYLQKMAEMAFTSKNIELLKKVIRRAVKGEITFYSKERALSLRDLHQKYVRDNIPEDEDDRQKLDREFESLEYLCENKQSFGGLLDLIKWSFGILKVKGESMDLTKATQTMEIVLSFFNERQILQILAL